MTWLRPKRRKICRGSSTQLDERWIPSPQTLIVSWLDQEHFLGREDVSSMPAEPTSSGSIWRLQKAEEFKLRPTQHSWRFPTPFWSQACAEAIFVFEKLRSMPNVMCASKVRSVWGKLRQLKLNWKRKENWFATGFHNGLTVKHIGHYVRWANHTLLICCQQIGRFSFAIFMFFCFQFRNTELNLLTFQRNRIFSNKKQKQQNLKRSSDCFLFTHISGLEHFPMWVACVP